jgi:hypothetical protein
MSTDAYLDAKAAFERIQQQIADAARSLVEVGNALQRSPGTFSFSNTSQGLPAEAIMSRDSVSANADRWPTAKRVMELLAEYHQAKSAMQQAWSNVPAGRRAGLVAPPGYRPDTGYR